MFKRKWRRLLATSLATTSFIFGSGGTIHAATDVKPDNSSGNNIEANTGNYTLNGTTTTISDGYGFVYGGGDETSSENSFNNRLNILGGTFSGIFGGMSALGGSAYNNYIIVNDGTITGVVGGLAIWHSGWDVGNVYGNTVIINGGTVGNVSGGEIGYSTLTDSSAVNTSNASGDAYNNQVIITGGKVTNGIIGGSALSGNAYGNSIEISGGSVSGEIIGGKSESGSAYGNTITIKSPADLSGATFWGGMIGSSPSYTDNTLNVYGAGLSAQNIGGFDKINFHVDDSNLSDFALKLSGSPTIGGNLEQSIDVYADPDSNFSGGQKINLLSSNGINFTNGSSVDTATKVMNKGAYGAYDLNINSDGSNIIGTIAEKVAEPNPVFPTPQPPIRMEAPTIFSEPAIDFEDDDLGELADDIKEVYEQHGFEVFFSAGGYRLKTKTGDGTWIRTSSSNYDLGFARTFNTASGKLYVAPVIEYGKGRFDAYLGRGKLWGQDVYGRGDSKYVAGGIVARKINKKGFYVEASARGGKTESNFSSSDYAFGGKRGVPNSYELHRVSYDTDAPIFISHVRVGQAKRLNKNNILDVYGLCFYMRQWGSDATVYNTYRPDKPDHLDFSAVNTARFRLGYRLTTRTSKISRIYTGLALQYEYNSNYFTTTDDGSELHGDGAKGSSGMLEIGWQIKPKRNHPWLVDINAQGWLGYQRGSSITAKMKKSF